MFKWLFDSQPVSIKPSRIEYQEGDTFGWLKRLGSSVNVKTINISRIENQNSAYRFRLLICLEGTCRFYNSRFSFYASDNTTRIPPNRIYIRTPHGGRDGHDLECLTKEIQIMSFSITFDRETWHYTVPWDNLE